jgi:hypothetical protein
MVSRPQHHEADGNRFITLYTTPTSLQEIAFERLGIDPRRIQ